MIEISEKMKVLYITMMYPVPKYPQKGIFCHEQVKALKQIGVDVDVIVPLPFYDKDYEKSEWDYEGIHIRYIRYFKLPGVRGFENIGKYLYHALKRAKIDFGQYDILHADAPLPAGDAMRIVSQKYDIPFVVHGHGLDVFLEDSYKNAKNCDKIVRASIRVYQEAAAIAGVSQKVLDQIQKKVDISKKGYVVYNGVDTDEFVPVGHKNQRIEIVSIGNLIPLKGHDYTIQAVKKIVEKGKYDIHLTIAGRGEKEAELKTLVEKLELSKYVQFVGYVTYDKIVSLLQNSDVFVLPSYYEALGCVYLEAMACGVPVIGCWGNGIDEIIRNGQDGYLVEGKKVESIVENVEKMLEKNHYKEMGRLARENVEKSYRWLDSAQSLREIYIKILG